LSLLIGLFDSGLGGLTVLRQVHSLYPHSRCLYLGDTARVPYGQRSCADLREIAAEVAHWLRHQGVGVLVMACNTSNAVAFDVAVAEAGVPVLGLIDSMAAEIRSDRVGVLATPATVASGAYRRAIQAARPEAEVLEIACPSFVPSIEAGIRDGAELRAAAKAHIEPLLAARVEAIVLGCTHYPMLRPMLKELVPVGVRLLDPAAAVARRLGPLLTSLGDPSERESQGIPLPPPMERTRFCVTGSARDFAVAATDWLGSEPLVRSVSLQSPVRGF
jgi:glutamate racemase